MDGGVTIATITEQATSVLTWLLSAATKCFEFITANPLAMLFILISIAFVGFKVVGRVIHR